MDSTLHVYPLETSTSEHVASEGKSDVTAYLALPCEWAFELISQDKIMLKEFLNGLPPKVLKEAYETQMQSGIAESEGLEALESRQKEWGNRSINSIKGWLKDDKTQNHDLEKRNSFFRAQKSWDLFRNIRAQFILRPLSDAVRALEAAASAASAINFKFDTQFEDRGKASARMAGFMEQTLRQLKSVFPVLHGLQESAYHPGLSLYSYIEVRQEGEMKAHIPLLQRVRVYRELSSVNKAEISYAAQLEQFYCTACRIYELYRSTQDRLQHDFINYSNEPSDALKSKCLRTLSFHTHWQISIINLFRPAMVVEKALHSLDWNSTLDILDTSCNFGGFVTLLKSPTYSEKLLEPTPKAINPIADTVNVRLELSEKARGANRPFVAAPPGHVGVGAFYIGSQKFGLSMEMNTAEMGESFNKQQQLTEMTSEEFQRRMGIHSVGKRIPPDIEISYRESMGMPIGGQLPAWKGWTGLSSSFERDGRASINPPPQIARAHIEPCKNGQKKNVVQTLLQPSIHPAPPRKRVRAELEGPSPAKPMPSTGNKSQPDKAKTKATPRTKSASKKVSNSSIDSIPGPVSLQSGLLPAMQSSTVGGFNKAKTASTKASTASSKKITPSVSAKKRKGDVYATSTINKSNTLQEPAQREHGLEGLASQIVIDPQNPFAGYSWYEDQFRLQPQAQSQQNIQQILPALGPTAGPANIGPWPSELYANNNSAQVDIMSFQNSARSFPSAFPVQQGQISGGAFGLAHYEPINSITPRLVNVPGMGPIDPYALPINHAVRIRLGIDPAYYGCPITADVIEVNRVLGFHRDDQNKPHVVALQNRGWNSFADIPSLMVPNSLTLHSQSASENTTIQEQTQMQISTQTLTTGSSNGEQGGMLNLNPNLGFHFHPHTNFEDLVKLGSIRTKPLQTEQQPEKHPSLRSASYILSTGCAPVAEATAAVKKRCKERMAELEGAYEDTTTVTGEGQRPSMPTTSPGTEKTLTPGGKSMSQPHGQNSLTPSTFHGDPPLTCDDDVVAAAAKALVAIEHEAHEAEKRFTSSVDSTVQVQKGKDAEQLGDHNEQVQPREEQQNSTRSSSFDSNTNTPGTFNLNSASAEQVDAFLDAVSSTNAGATEGMVTEFNSVLGLKTENPDMADERGGNFEVEETEKSDTNITGEGGEERSVVETD